MGSKRPDQYAVDAGEPNAKDNETLSGPAPQIEEKQKLAESRAEATRESFIPQGGKNPALADLQQRREQRQNDEEARRAEGDEAHGGESRGRKSRSRGSRDDDRSDVATRGDRRSPDAERTE